MHGSTREHTSASGQVPRKAEIQKHGAEITPIVESGHQLLGRYARVFLGRGAERKEKLIVPGSFTNRPTVPRTYPLPIQICHHLINIGGCLRAKIEMLGMLVHIECENRSSARQAVRMVRRPLVNQPAQAIRPNQDHPASTAC